MKLKKKGGMLDSTLGRVIIGVALLIVILSMIWITRGKLSSMWRSFARILRFG